MTPRREKGCSLNRIVAQIEADAPQSACAAPDSRPERADVAPGFVFVAPDFCELLRRIWESFARSGTAPHRLELINGRR
jgi:hypothetical protein